MMKIVQIVWEDSCFLHGWHEKKELEDFVNETEWIDSVGFLIGETSSHYVLSQSFGRDVGDSIKIPKPIVKSIETLKEVDYEVNIKINESMGDVPK